LDSSALHQQDMILDVAADTTDIANIMTHIVNLILAMIDVLIILNKCSLIHQPNNSRVKEKATTYHKVVAFLFSNLPSANFS
jgi:hypothetical protein